MRYTGIVVAEYWTARAGWSVPFVYYGTTMTRDGTCVWRWGAR